MAKIARSAVPNVFTFANLGCGVMSLMMTFQENYKWAAIFILLACLADRYDGRVARMLNVSSELGKELDSLADLVSFGVAPAILAFNIYSFASLGIAGYLLAILFPISGAYRLARFNVTEFDGEFYGIPITFAGMFMALYCFVTMNYLVPQGVTAIIMLALAYLMVCKHRFKKF
ncbi:CDP-diacylglycerol--serine O-phosphatidyltransferase [Clostridium thailandense]|uniref:CDP-diacylglycerol--serine O-phosphatidyltransferase n=1 Tax=Clostridium thailandense TaxID=2794346 RepID=A0A949TVE0_9CLOT|nr:CDP-diacylglycerol--serine O-phosphatidyltransferase [Clostridium thailandense]MBV7272155.1 CDP-diacylglycerol--serine O-phosphatidyltransferase [Clostridium thailandense]MCH5135993.1 CDP-diacylglycerol--serine O-phosphatidyltransferase [Clostridiaceae bacterium UIB06]